MASFTFVLEPSFKTTYYSRPIETLAGVSYMIITWSACSMNNLKNELYYGRLFLIIHIMIRYIFCVIKAEQT